MKYDNILETIGNTPHIRINSLYPANYEVWMKNEKSNPGGSIKDRIALAMIEEAEQNNTLNASTTIIEPTSGNTGIGLAMVARAKGYRLILVMPETVSRERKQILQAYGVEIESTPGTEGIKGAISRSYELAKDIKESWMPMQFNNQANPKIHQTATAKEILNDFPEGFDYLITGVGTGGHITGVAEVLKQYFPKIQVFAVEPENSQVIAGHNPGKHPIQGIGAGFVPEVLNRDILDGTIPISKEEAFDFTRKVAREEGILVGISSGASLAAVSKKIKDTPPNSRILTFSYDTGERYLSIEELFDPNQVDT